MEINKRILIIDDHPDIHEDFRKVLQPKADEGPQIAEVEVFLFGTSYNLSPKAEIYYDLSFAAQGKEGFEKVLAADKEDKPFSLVFVDIRMPPGWDGMETVRHIWQHSPYTEIVMCSAYRDYDWNEIVASLGSTNSLVFLKKPFESQVVRQMALVMTQKWTLGHRARSEVRKLEWEVERRTSELKSLMQKLEHKTSALREAEVQISAAKEDSLAKSEFLVTMNNELRISLNNIVSMSNLVLATPMNRKQTALVKNIQSSCDVLMAIVNEIMDFSKVVSGKLDLESIDFNLDQIERDVKEWVLALLERKTVTLETTILETVPRHLVGDPGRLRQVLANLMGNAIKLASSGQIQLIISLLEEGEFSTALRFEVIYQGHHLTALEERHIFSSFIQADIGTPLLFSSQAVGLAVSRKLIALMGGHIGIDKGARDGGAFWFELPFGKQNPKAKRPEPVLGSVKGKHVLLVQSGSLNDDFVDSLNEEGMVADCVHNGRAMEVKLLEAAQQGESYDFAIIDFLMPDFNGFELAARIKKHEALKHSQLILVTDYGSRGDGALARRLGLQAYLVKPISNQALLKCLRMLCSDLAPEGLITRYHLVGP